MSVSFGSLTNMSPSKRRAHARAAGECAGSRGDPPIAAIGAVSTDIAAAGASASMRRLLRTVHVAWLIALIAVPCTAPFSTCDLADLLPADRAPQRRLPRPLDVAADRALPHGAAAGRSVARVRHPRAVSSGTPPRVVVSDEAAQLARVTAALGHLSTPLHRILRI